VWRIDCCNCAAIPEDRARRIQRGIDRVAIAVNVAVAIAIGGGGGGGGGGVAAVPDRSSRKTILRNEVAGRFVLVYA
jgi:hypothetical protein